MKYRLALAAVMALVLAGCGSGTPSGTLSAQPPTDAGSEPQPATTPLAASAEPVTQQAQVGSPVMVTSGDKVSKITILSAKYSHEPLGYSTPDNGGYLILDVLWESVKGTADVNYLLFNAKDSTGVQQHPAFVSGLDMLASASVPAGDKLRGAVVFDIAGGPWIVTMGAFTEAARWTIS